MSEPTSEPRRLSAAQARRLLSALSLRPGERILCLGPDGGPVPSVAAILVGPTGRIVEANPAAVTAGEPLPYPDDEFDAVIIDVIAPHPHQAHLLTEAGRVTAPTGRIALATPPPSSQESASAPQLAEAAGLRGVAVRTDTATEADTEPVELVTAFPPRPATAGDYAATTELHQATPAAQPAPASPVGQPAKSRRTRMLVGATTALAVAAAAGVLWGLAGADPGQDSPEDQSDVLAGTAGLDVDQPGADGQPAADDPPTGDGLPTNDTGSDLESDSGASVGSGGSGGSSGSGGGQSSNRPPVIDSPGLDSGGLLLRLNPEVSDPDGDDVTLLYDVDGMEVDPIQQLGVCPTPTDCRVDLDFADIGYQRDIPVTIIATDTHGAATRETYSHSIQAVTEVNFTEFRYAIDDPGACFRTLEGRDLSYRVSLNGAIAAVIEDSPRITALTPSGPLGGTRVAVYEGEQPPPLSVSIQVTLSDFRRTTFTASPYSSDEKGTVVIARNSSCEGVVRFEVRFETR
jgi:hypothetical protein